jgi:transposase
VLSVFDAEPIMRGPPKSRDLDEPIRVSLNDRVPPSRFSRHLERTLDLAFVRDLVRDAYAEIGRPSIDPVVFFKRQLILFFEGLRAERQLLRVEADRLSLRWQLGYDLSEALPDHSSLTRIRERYGVEIFRRFFDVVVAQCIAAGLVWGRELFIRVAATAVCRRGAPCPALREAGRAKRR